MHRVSSVCRYRIYALLVSCSRCDFLLVILGCVLGLGCVIWFHSLVLCWFTLSALGYGVLVSLQMATYLPLTFCRIGDAFILLLVGCRVVANHQSTFRACVLERMFLELSSSHICSTSWAFHISGILLFFHTLILVADGGGCILFSLSSLCA